MAEKLCELRKKGGGGGKYTETSLWTNPSPSAVFAAQTVTLSDNINNYKYLKVSYKNNPTQVGVNDPFSVLISVSDFKTSLSNNSTRHNAFTFGGLYAPTGSTWTRFLFYDTDTTARFGGCTQIGSTGSTNNNAIPLEILGLNELDHGTKTWDSGTIPYNASATTKVTLGYKPKILILRYYKSTSNMIDNIYTDSISTSTYQRWVYSGSASMANMSLPQGTTNSRCITSIDNDGFTAGPNDDSTYTCYYWATGES